jgi:hypothetical protein
LHNARYAGAFVFGKTRSWKDAEGRPHYEHLPIEQWRVLNKDAHDAYISWEDFESNLKVLKENCKGYGENRKQRVPGQGPALLQGIVLCGKCGRGMTLRYHWRRGRETPDYMCQHDSIENGQALCQSICGAPVDEAVESLLLQSVTPLSLETILDVREKLEERLKDVDKLRRQRVERARYEAEKARQRYLQVDGANRLVAASLEAEWNEKLRLLQEAEEVYQKQKSEARAKFTQQQKEEVLQLATNFPKLWRDPATSDKDRKRMARLLLKDVTLTKSEEILVQVRFTGGATRELRLPLSKNSWQLRQTAKVVLTEIDRLLDTLTDGQIANEFNERAWRSGSGKAFTQRIVQNIRRSHQLKSRLERLRERGLKTASEIARLIGSKASSVKYWRQQGLLEGELANDKLEYLYFPPSKAQIAQMKGRTRLRKR